MGEVPEWSNGADSKSVVPARVPRVRIPVSPPLTQYAWFYWVSNSALIHWKRTPNLLHWFLLDLLRLRRYMFTVWYEKWYFRWQHLVAS
jgi:hypothetical protein